MLWLKSTSFQMVSPEFNPLTMRSSLTLLIPLHLVYVVSLCCNYYIMGWIPAELVLIWVQVNIICLLRIEHLLCQAQKKKGTGVGQNYGNSNFFPGLLLHATLCLHSFPKQQCLENIIFCSLYSSISYFAWIPFH